jgi:putative hydrolase of the HAD superfamily
VTVPAAVTVDAFGTLLQLRDPIAALQAALRRHEFVAAGDDVQRAFRAEVDFYVPLAHTGRDASTLAALRTECAGVFLASLEAPIEAAAFADDFIGALEFELLPGARESCDELVRREIPTAVVSNWDIGLHDHLQTLGVVLPVVTSAEAGSPKPDPAIFRLALERLGVEGGEAVHIGDSADDEEGARAAGLRFEPAPLEAALRRIL